MPGFNLSIGKQNMIFQQISFNTNLINNSFQGNDFFIQRFTLNKFINDKIFFEDDKCIIVLEGVVLNKSDLIDKNNNLSWETIVWNLYLNTGNNFFKVFKGSFSGLLFDKLNNKWIIFTDHIGSKHIYYYKSSTGQFIFTSEISNLYFYLNKSNIKPALNQDAAYMLLSYGYMLYNNTLCLDIHKLIAGHYILIENEEFNIEQYYKIGGSFINYQYTEDELIEELDIRFRKAIKLQFEKDKEYGYKHFVALSGGLDSRMTSWVAHQMGYNKQINFTFSQSDYLDETIPKKIAADLKHEWIFKALDNGLFLEDIEEITKMTGGNVLYYGLAHGNSLLKYINFDYLGIVHTGQVGGIVKGYYPKGVRTIGRGYYSKTLIHKVDINTLGRYELERDFLLLNRQFNGTLYGDIVSQRRSETISPFLSVDLLELCLNSAFFNEDNSPMIKWILKKYPKAAEYVLESTKMKVNRKILYLKYKGKKKSLNRILPRLLLKMGLKKQATLTKNHMNPLDYWYKKNSDIKEFQDSYFWNTLKLLDDYAELKKDCEMLYLKGNAIEKNQVLTLLSALKLYFI